MEQQPVQSEKDRFKHWEAELKDVSFILHSLVDCILRNGFEEMANELNQANISVNHVRRLIQTDLDQ